MEEYSWESWVFGLAGVACSCLFFGSFGVPIKLPPLSNSGLASFYLQGYKGIGNLLVTFPVVILLGGIRTPLLALDYSNGSMILASIAAVLWVISGNIAILAIRLAGLGLAQAIWSSTSILVSFAWGSLYFSDPMPHPLLTVVALFFLSLSLSTLCLTLHSAVGKASEKEIELVEKNKNKNMENEEGNDSGDDDILVNAEGGQAEELLVVDGETACAVGASSVRVHSSRVSASQVLGIFLAGIVGVIAGCLVVPFRLCDPSLKYAYVFNLSWIAAVASIAQASLFAIVPAMIVDSPIPQPKIMRTLWSGSLVGALWGLGNMSALVVTYFLGQITGMPLVQAQLLVSSTWGILLFKEGSTLVWRRIVAAAAATATTISCALLAFST